MNQLLQLRVVPLSAVAFEQYIGFPRPPAAGRILWHSGAPGCAPDVQNGIHKGPRRFHAVAAIEKRSVAADAIVEERGVGAACRAAKSLAIAEVHGDVTDAHLGSRTFSAERNGDTFIGLNVQDQTIGFNLALAEDDVRRTTELDHDFRKALGEALAGSKIERNAGPTPVVNQQFGGNKGLGLGGGIHAGLLAV